MEDRSEISGQEVLNIKGSDKFEADEVAIWKPMKLLSLN